MYFGFTSDEVKEMAVYYGASDKYDEICEWYDRLTSIVSGKSFPTYIDTGVIYPQIKNNPSTIYSFLLAAGYLKATKTTSSFNGDFMCEVSLPNKELSFVYNKEIFKKLKKTAPRMT